jgi:hypothetical protein
LSRCEQGVAHLEVLRALLKKRVCCYQFFVNTFACNCLLKKFFAAFLSRGEQGVARPEVLRTLLKSTDRIVQEIDSVEYGLTDIQEYYANTGAMKAAAETMREGKKVRLSFIVAQKKRKKKSRKKKG